MNEIQEDCVTDGDHGCSLYAAFFYKNHAPVVPSTCLLPDESCIVASQKCTSKGKIQLASVRARDNEESLIVESFREPANNGRMYCRITNKGFAPVTLDPGICLGSLYESADTFISGSEGGIENPQSDDLAIATEGQSSKDGMRSMDYDSRAIVVGFFFLFLITLFDLILVALQPSDLTRILAGTNALFIGVGTGIFAIAMMPSAASLPRKMLAFISIALIIFSGLVVLGILSPI